MDGKNLKIILKDLLGEYIPAELYDRPKQGFSVPMHKFFRNELRDSMEAYINSNKLYQAFPFINKSALIDRWHSFLNSNNCSGMYDFWRLYMLAQWYEAQ
jgi:asparagine synthase (glutamine-hydrolysing)